MKFEHAERWLANVRLAAVAFAVVEVGVFTESYPEGYQLWAWVLTIPGAAIVAACVYWVLAVFS